MPIMLNSLLPVPGIADRFYFIPGWGVRFIGNYIGVCPADHDAIEMKDDDAPDYRTLWSLDLQTGTRKENEIIRPQKVFCVSTQNLPKKTLQIKTSVMQLLNRAS